MRVRFIQQVSTHRGTHQIGDELEMEPCPELAAWFEYGIAEAVREDEMRTAVVPPAEVPEPKRGRGKK